MATIKNTLDRGILDVFTPPEWEPRLSIRPLYIAPTLLQTADTTAALHDKALAIGRRTLFEHLLMAFCDFTCEKRYRTGDLKRVMPTGDGIWKMHAPGLRIYGWVPAIHEFAAVTFATERETKADRSLNSKKKKEVQDFIKRHGLGETIVRGDINAVFPHRD
jgi:hypothetical protein